MRAVACTCREQRCANGRWHRPSYSLHPFLTALLAYTRFEFITLVPPLRS